MKTFQEIKNKLELVRYIGSEFGTMYFEPNVPKDKETIIRHLDGILSIELLSTYVKLYNSILNWIENSKVKKYVKMPELQEVGKDYIIRPFYVYHIAICDYFDEEEPVESPVQFSEMNELLLREVSHLHAQKAILGRVLKKSLIEPTGKTYFEYDINKFIIVEPKISIKDLLDWQKSIVSD